ncbi:hypothetical protein AK812_SmicGene7381 [Symbiodinium microadriaticum]|uniref:Uncharacterized protein n=1 Tax=Symbiodinium microadriaticum TaxID=2951 RepID=A0A1Q9ENQ6_SYMMI|nr:hypothetical protein AK812_SmicGene7381 [Symbiodinium microadriaticum]
MNTFIWGTTLAAMRRRVAGATARRSRTDSRRKHPRHRSHWEFSSVRLVSHHVMGWQRVPLLKHPNVK